MNRLDVLQVIVDKIQAETYLEIGVNRGQVISHLRCPRKIGVDPAFQFGRRLKLQRLLGQVRFTTVKATSDAFFADRAAALLPRGVDVVFVDGLHTCQQVLTDVDNSLRYLNPGGVIVIHDCNPLNRAGASPITRSVDEVVALAANGDLPGWNGCWSGDVWKAVGYLRATRHDLRVFTLDLDWGLGIVERGLDRSGGSDAVAFPWPGTVILEADYSFLERHRETVLALKEPRHLFAWLDQRRRPTGHADHAPERTGLASGSAESSVAD